jgi:hypothetical protein
MEADGEPARIGIRIVVRKVRNTGRIGEPHRYGSGGACGVRSSRQRCRFCGGLEAARQQNAFGVSRAKTGVPAEHDIELFEQVVGQLDDPLIRRKWHDSSLLRLIEYQHWWGGIDRPGCLSHSSTLQPHEELRSAGEPKPVQGSRPRRPSDCNPVFKDKCQRWIGNRYRRES